MTTVSPSSTSPSLRPPKKSPPEDRDLEIFKLAVIHGWTHDKIAMERGLTRRRVSQIVQEVRRWFSNHAPYETDLQTEFQRQRYARAVERMRLEDIIARAVHGLDCAPGSLTTTRHTEGGPFERTSRDQPPVDVLLLRMYLRAVIALSKLDDRPEPPPPDPELEGQPWRHPNIQKFIKDWQDSHIDYISHERLPDFAEKLTIAILGCLNVPAEPANSAPDPDEPDEPDPAPLSVPGSPLGPHHPEAPASLPCSAPYAAGTADSASHVSLPEAPTSSPFSNPSAAITIDHTDTSDEPTAAPTADSTTKTAAEKIKKGSADYAPDNRHDVPITPVPISNARHLSVTQLSIAPDIPGALIHVSVEPHDVKTHPVG